MPVKKKKAATRKRATPRKRAAPKKRVSISKPIKKRKMAKRKRSTKKTTTRRRRSSISGTGGQNNIMNLVMLAGGAVAAKVISAKLSAKMNPKILAGAQIAFAIMAPKMMRNNKTIAAIATGVGVNGLLMGLSSFGILSNIAGMAGVDEIQMESLSGTDQLSILAGDDDGMGLLDEGIMSGTDMLSEIAGGGEDWESQINGFDGNDEDD